MNGINDAPAFAIYEGAKMPVICLTYMACIAAYMSKRRSEAFADRLGYLAIATIIIFDSRGCRPRVSAFTQKHR
ncbi:MAG: hypothetical protein ACLT3W_06255 [Bifidobacterium pseudocatenulatum]